MRYAISMTDLEGAWDKLPHDRQQAILTEHERFKDELLDAGKFVDALHYHPRSEARTVGMDPDGSMRTLDGPFNDAPEHISGVYVIDCDSMDEAVEWARKARFMVGANEVRAIWD